jgi:excisionase family DNA binding protein
MEKICIVKRRRPIQETTLPPRMESDGARACDGRSPLLSIELTPQQTELIRNNSHFRHLYAGEMAPIFLNIHFGGSPLQKMLKPGDICEMLQVSRHTLDRLVKTGCLKSYRIGRQRRFAVQDVMDYLANECGTTDLRSVHVEVVGRPEREFETFSTR